MLSQYTRHPKFQMLKAGHLAHFLPGCQEEARVGGSENSWVASDDDIE